MWAMMVKDAFVVLVMLAEVVVALVMIGTDATVAEHTPHITGHAARTAALTARTAELHNPTIVEHDASSLQVVVVVVVVLIVVE